MLAFLVLVFCAPVPERSPLTEEEMRGVVQIVRSSFIASATSLSRASVETVNDEQVFLKGQRAQLRGLQAIVAAVQDDFSRERDPQKRRALLEGSNDLRVAISAALKVLDEAERGREIEACVKAGHSLSLHRALEGYDKQKQQQVGVSEFRAVVP